MALRPAFLILRGAPFLVSSGQTAKSLVHLARLRSQHKRQPSQ
ncbi:Uncharacterised protein [Vibrio cholerae]|nr:Uncharacterised protein [Vibrio cholerae]